MIIDSHQHIWDPNQAEYSWLTSDLAPINRTILFPEFAAKMKTCGIDYTVIVQSADNLEDTELMLQAAKHFPQVIGIVAYVPLEDPARTHELLSEFHKNPIIVGIRNLIHTYPNPLWLKNENVNKGLDLLEEFGMTFDVVSVNSDHLGLLPFLSERHPRLKMVIDHLSKPPIDEGIKSERGRLWISQMADAASNPNVYAKVSGLYSGASDTGAITDAVRPFVIEALEIFGSDRLMYGGDWPISVLSGDYEKVFDYLSDIISELSERDQANIFSESAKNFYGLRI